MSFNHLPSILHVGIITAPQISVSFHGQWKDSEGRDVTNQRIDITVPCQFEPLQPDATFTLHNVMIGINYHWQRYEKQTFTGGLEVIEEADKLTAVNLVPIEDYLMSVVSSEMSASAGLEFLKAAAVISRSWVIRQILNKKEQKTPQRSQEPVDGSLVYWFDHEDHTLYDVCADDHCQRYQGITRISNPIARQAVEETRGQILVYGDEVCDCRFSKCCGGRTEEFSTCWEDKPVPYLPSIVDGDDDGIFCATTDKAILAQVLNNYDQETTDFYEWEQRLSQEEISRLLNKELQRDFGQILSLTPIKRGPSGRISLLQVKGTKNELTIGKELVIRSALSDTHLYSSAFEIEALNASGSPVASESNEIPHTFVLRGKGWGHGVGLCQIGAAVMGSKGYTYDQILSHYYPGTTIYEQS